MIPLVPREMPRENVVAPTSGGMVRQVRMVNYRRIVATVVSGTLRIYRFDCSNPDAVEAVDTLVLNGVSSCSLSVRQCGALDLFYVRDGTIYHALSRDCGQSWRTTVVASGSYMHVAHALGGGVLLQARLSGGTWTSAVGVLQPDGSTFVFTSEHDIGIGDDAPATLSCRPDGSWQLVCLVSGQPVIYICRDLNRQTGDGTWVSVPATELSGYSQVARGTGPIQHVLPVFDASNSMWQAVVVSWGVDGAPAFALGGQIAEGRDAGADLIREPDGSWALAYMPVDSTTPTIIRSRNLNADGAGSWG